MAINWNWVPYFEGKLLTYHQYFALVGSTGCLVLAIINFLIYYLIKKYCVKRGGEYVEVVQGEAIVEKEKKKKTCIEKVIGFFFGAGFVWMSLVPVVCMAMDVIPFVGGLGLNFGILALWVALINYQDYQEERVHNFKSSSWLEFKKSLKYKRPALKKKWIYLALGSLLLNCLTYRTCVCFYNDQIVYYNKLLGFSLSTMITRLLALPIACPEGGPCQLYTTLPEDSITSVFVNIHTHHAVDNVTVYYAPIDSLNDSDFKTVKAQTYNYKGLDFRERRNVHSALIRELQPETKYLIKIFYNGQFWAVSTYKTLSNDPINPIRMINAGDSGYTKSAVELTKIVATLKPDVFFIGGDIAYDDNLPACMFTWDYYLGMYGSLTTSIGYMMPIVLGVGNHDVGLNQLPGINITINEYGPAYFLFFPQHYDRDANFQIVYQIPPLHRRRTVFYHTFSNMQYICLDSGYLLGFGGWQQKLLIEFLSMYPKKAKFINYHVPIYSVCQDFDVNDKRYLYALFHWIPHFDEYKVMTVFQNHVHSFKRTKPLIGNYPNQNGTVYVGDGAFGAVIDILCKPDRTIDLFQTHGHINHFWFSVVTNYVVTHSAYNKTGHIIDNFTQDFAKYTL